MSNCCPEFEMACEPCSDSENFSTLITETDNGFHVGSSDLPPIKFCPWCGWDKRKPSEE
jgi:hypothetical protein